MKAGSKMQEPLEPLMELRWVDDARAPRAAAAAEAGLMILDLIKRAMHDDFSLSPFNLHIWLNMFIIIFPK
jgi:hypothetical protein